VSASAHAAIGHLHSLKSEVAAWRRRAERDECPILWKFTVSDARRVFRYDGIIIHRGALAGTDHSAPLTFSCVPCF
jgi:hypothetical protein